MIKVEELEDLGFRASGDSYKVVGILPMNIKFFKDTVICEYLLIASIRNIEGYISPVLWLRKIESVELPYRLESLDKDKTVLYEGQVNNLKHFKEILFNTTYLKLKE